MIRRISRTQKIVLAACVLGYAVSVLAVGAYRAREDQSSTSDFDDFWMTGRHFIRTGEVTTDYGVHNYLPFFILFTVPFALLPLKVASVVFNATGLAGFVFSVRRVDGWFDRDDREALAHRGGSDPPPGGPLRVAAPVGMVLVYVTGCLIMGQMALYTLTMLVLTWHCVEGRRDAAAGFWLALAISTKLYPAVLILFFVLKRKRRLLGGAAASLVVMNLVLPYLAFGSQDAWRLHAEFWKRSVRGQSTLRLAVVESNKMGYANQSAAIVARRYTRPTDSGVDGADGRPRFVNVVQWDATPVGPKAVARAPVQWLLSAAAVALVAAAAWICRRRACTADLPRLRYEYAAFILLSLLLCPIVWSFYYCLCYLPLALLNRRVLATWHAGHRLGGSAAVAALWWLALPAVASPFARMCGTHLLATGALFVTMLALAVRSGRATSPATPALDPGCISQDGYTEQAPPSAP